MPTLETFSDMLGWALVSCFLTFLWSPILIDFLYKFKITRRSEIGLNRPNRDIAKAGTPIMGGLLVIITVAILTLAFNWDRRYTWMPVGIMLFSALLGGVDDLLNIFGKERRSRKLKHVLTLIKVHKDLKMRIWYILTLPWSFFKRASLLIGSHPGKGVHVHEKLILQFAAGAAAAWWIYAKLGIEWHYAVIPFIGPLYLGCLIIPLIILTVMFTANAVNIADGMYGLAGGMLVTTFSALMLLSWMDGLNQIAILDAMTLGALVTYTYFNIKPARFQMGDTGSLGLGALLAVNALAIGEIGSLFFLGFLFYIEAFSVV